MRLLLGVRLFRSVLVLSEFGDFAGKELHLQDGPALNKFMDFFHHL